MKSPTSRVERPFFQSYFGVPNFGDELLCRAVVGMFDVAGTGRVAARRPKISRVTLRGTGARTVLGKFPHRGFWVGLPLRLWYLSRASQLFIGGGGVIQDTFSPATIMSSTFDVSRAVGHDAPFAFVGIEIGNVAQPESRVRAEFALKHAAVVWCRDQRSFERAQELGAGDRAFLAPDLAHSFLRSWPTAGSAVDTNEHCVVNVRVLAQDHPDAFRALIADLCDRYSRVTLASAQPGEEKGWVALLRDRPANLEVFSSGGWQATLELLDSASVLIAERFHFIAAGAHLGLPVIPLLATHKATQLAAEMGIADGQSIQIAEYSHDRALTAIDAARPVATEVLDELAASVNAAVRVTRQAMAREVVYTGSAKEEARQISRDILRSGAGLMSSALRRRLRRAR